MLKEKDSKRDTNEYSLRKIQEMKCEEALKAAIKAIESTGRDPANQLTGYLTTGEPAYITSTDNARTKLDRQGTDKIINLLVIRYISRLKEEKE